MSVVSPWESPAAFPGPANAHSPSGSASTADPDSPPGPESTAAPARREAARAALAHVNQAHGTDYVLLAPMRGGWQSGAWRIRDGRGAAAVFKCASDSGPWARVVLAAEPKVAAARAQGYPTPAWLACGLTPDGFPYEVQELVDGRPAERLTADLARQLVDVLEHHAAGCAPPQGADPRSSWSVFAMGEVNGDAEDGLRRRVARLGPDAAELVGRFDALRARTGPLVLPEGDLVHGDMNLGNVLVDGQGRVVALVDVEALGGGSRVFDYATLWAAADDDAADDSAAEAAGDAEALRIVQEAGARAVGPEALALCVAWNVLELLRFVSDRRGGLDRGRLVDGHRRLDRVERWLGPR